MRRDCTRNKFLFNRKTYLISGIYLVLICLVAYMYFFPAGSSRNAPVQEFIQCEALLMENRIASINAGKQSSCEEAEYFMQNAIREWIRQEDRWILIRNYNETRRLIDLSLLLAHKELEEHQRHQIKTISDPGQFDFLPGTY